MPTRRTILQATVAIFAAGIALSSKQHHASVVAQPFPMMGGAGPTRMVDHYHMPEVALVDQDGLPVLLHNELQRQGPVLMNFIYTACPGLCPILSAIFSRTAVLLGDDLDQTRLWSISLDPDFDTPDRLSKYAVRFNAPRQWRFFTGQSMAVKAILKAFDADSDNKTAHRALVFLRTKDNAWVRLEGEFKPERLAAEVRANLVP